MSAETRHGRARNDTLTAAKYLCRARHGARSEDPSCHACRAIVVAAVDGTEAVIDRALCKRIEWVLSLKVVRGDVHPAAMGYVNVVEYQRATTKLLGDLLLSLPTADCRPRGTEE